MYKLLIVDDEDIEREGMACFIPWSDYNVELVGTAWNGVEGFEKIQNEKPDIVLTDIKMPVMDGIELIRRTKKDFPDVEFVVLSGYGEYEFTSQAMSEGVRYYILKPCDEEKITGILEKVKVDVDRKRADKRKATTYRRLLPRAKEQLFRNMLLEREQIGSDYRMFLEELGNKEPCVRLLALHIQEKFDYLEQFVLGNILSELLGKNSILLSTAIRQEVVFLLDKREIPEIREAVERTKAEFRRLGHKSILAAVSETGGLGDVGRLYEQVQELFRIGSTEQQTGLLYYGLFREIQEEAGLLVDYRRLEEADDYGDILFEVYLAFVKMELLSYTMKQKQEVCGWVMRILYGEDCRMPRLEGIGDPVWELLVQSVDCIAEKQNAFPEETREGKRIRDILLAAFANIQNPNMSIQFLAKEVLFMNEEYFGRLFARNRNMKFSAFLLEQRIGLAQRLLQYDPELKITRLAQMTGYSPDGQYFSKAFRKITGMSPTEYRDMLKVQ